MNQNITKQKILKTVKNKKLISHNDAGYDVGTQEDKSTKLDYKLSLDAIARLIKSYYNDTQSIDSGNVYLGSFGSSDRRTRLLCHMMLTDIKAQMNKHGLDGKKMMDEIFDHYFKEEYEAMDRFNKNHPFVDLNNFVQCEDPKCCRKNKNLHDQTDKNKKM